MVILRRKEPMHHQPWFSANIPIETPDGLRYDSDSEDPEQFGAISIVNIWAVSNRFREKTLFKPRQCQE